MIRFKKTFTEPYPEHREKGYTKAGIRTFHGRAFFTDRNSISVEGNRNNDNTALKGKSILIATGAKPTTLRIPGSENIITSDDFLNFDHEDLPDRIVFVGGGYISFEFAHIVHERE